MAPQAQGVKALIPYTDLFFQAKDASEEIDFEEDSKGQQDSIKRNIMFKQDHRCNVNNLVVNISSVNLSPAQFPVEMSESG